MASGMLSFLLPEKITQDVEGSIAMLENNQFWDNCQRSIERSIDWFIKAGIELSALAHETNHNALEVD